MTNIKKGRKNKISATYLKYKGKKPKTKMEFEVAELLTQENEATVEIENLKPIEDKKPKSK